MAELQKEICKRWRGNDNLEQIAEETADVEIMLTQLKMMLGIEQKTEEYRQKKVIRLLERMRVDGIL